MRPPQVFLLIFSLFSLCTAAVAQESYKCNVGGASVYQDRPCSGTVRRSDSMPPAKASAVASPPLGSTPMETVGETSPTARPAMSDTERQKAFLAKGAKERKIADIQYEVSRTEAEIGRLQSAMQVEIAALDRQKPYANNNLAGATYLQSLATEQQAISTRYGIEISTQTERLKQLREQLAAAKRE